MITSKQQEETKGQTEEVEGPETQSEEGPTRQIEKEPENIQILTGAMAPELAEQLGVELKRKVQVCPKKAIKNQPEVEMLIQIDGTELTLPTWKMPEYEMTLDYYDGPRLVLRKDEEDIYLTWWNDEDEATERWLYLNVTRERLREILSGEITDREALTNPENKSLIVLDIDRATGETKRVVSTTPENIPQDSLPHPDARINIPIPQEYR